MFDPPPQLRVHTDLDGVHIRVSGQPRPRLASLQRSEVQRSLFGVVVGALLLSPSTGLWLAAIFAAVPAGLLVLTGLLALASATENSRVVFTANQLRVHSDGPLQAIDWSSVGRVRADGGEHGAIHIQVASADPITVRMDLEPAEHAAWLASAIEARARAARERRGSSVDVPRKIRQLRS